MSSGPETVTVTGGCHCQKVQFSAEAEKEPTILVCNCSICRRSGYRHLFVPHEHFTLISGEDALISYRFGSEQAQHLFCKYCGVKSFYQPRSHPESWSVHLDCLEDISALRPVIKAFNGKEWESSVASLEK